MDSAIHCLNNWSLVKFIFKIRGGPKGYSMDWVYEGVHGLGPQVWSVDPGSMFCIRPFECISAWHININR